MVVGLTLLWVYFRHHERFAGFRNWLIVANVLGLVCYVLVPTAPPRMFPEWGFVDTLAQYSGVNHESGIIAHTANPYAAMPSLHSMDAFIVGIVMFGVCRSPIVRRSLAACGRPGCGSRSWEPATTTGSTSSPAWRSRWLTGLRSVPAHAVLALAPADRGFVSGREGERPRVSELDRVKQEYTQAARADPAALDAAASRRRS